MSTPKPGRATRTIAYHPGDDAVAVMRTAARAVETPELLAYLTAIEHVHDLREEIAATKSPRLRAVLQRTLKTVEENARAARAAAGLP